jgi:glyoxylase-like metal-dependent hydrolase (beta-lactamase superfamily II)
MLLLVLALTGLVGTSAQNQTLEIVELGSGVYAAVHSEFRMDPIQSNSLIVVGDDGVLVVDTGRTPHSARAMIAEIRRRTDRPVRVVVNTHWHDDHVFGNQAYAEAFPGVVFAAHAVTREEMVQRSIPGLATYGVEYWRKMAEGFEQRLAKGTRTDGTPLSDEQKTRLADQARTIHEFLPKIPEQRIVLATLTFVDRLTIHLGRREVQVLQFGPGNTAGDVVVFLPKEKIVATGDLVVHPVPFAYGSAPGPWVSTLEQVRGLGAEAVVPGHGPVMRDTVYLDQLIAMFGSLVKQVNAAAAKGLTLEETRKAVDLEIFAKFFGGDDAFRRATFADSVLREAVERAYQAARRG